MKKNIIISILCVLIAFLFSVLIINKYNKQTTEVKSFTTDFKECKKELIEDGKIIKKDKKQIKTDNQTIEDLKKQIEEKNNEINDLNNKIEEKDAEINRLKN